MSIALIIFGAIAVIIAIITIKIGATFVGVFAAVIGFVLLAMGIPCAVVELVLNAKRKKKKQKDKEDKKHYENGVTAWKRNKLEEILQKQNIPSSLKVVTLVEMCILETIQSNVQSNIFVQEGKLCFIPTRNELRYFRDNSGNYFSGSMLDEHLRLFYTCTQIPIESINSFFPSGDLYQEHKISGGGDGGRDVAGALAGYFVAGPLGMLIGGRRKTEAIKSKLITHDTRKTIISYYQDEEEYWVALENDDYRVLDDLIPEKNYDFVIEVKRQGLKQKLAGVDTSYEITEQIKALAKLKDEGILTEDEFMEKKKELLAKI